MNKYLKYGIVFILLIILLYLLNSVLEKDSAMEIKNYLINSGYKEIGNNTLSKILSYSTSNQFSLNNYTLTQKVEENSNNIKSSLNATYDYKTHELIYNYRIEYSDNINVLYRGEYKNDSFTCDKEFSTASLSTSEINNTCSLVKIKVERFYNEAEVLFPNYNYVKYMEEQNN